MDDPPTPFGKEVPVSEPAGEEAARLQEPMRPRQQLQTLSMRVNRSMPMSELGPTSENMELRSLSSNVDDDTELFQSCGSTSSEPPLLPPQGISLDHRVSSALATSTTAIHSEEDILDNLPTLSKRISTAIDGMDSAHNIPFVSHHKRLSVAKDFVAFENFSSLAEDVSTRNTSRATNEEAGRIMLERIRMTAASTTTSGYSSTPFDNNNRCDDDLFDATVAQDREIKRVEDEIAQHNNHQGSSTQTSPSQDTSVAVSTVHRPDSGFEKVPITHGDSSPSQDTSTSRADCFEKVPNVRDSVTPSQYTSTSVDSTTRPKSGNEFEEQAQRPDSGFEKVSNARDDSSPSQDTSASVGSIARQRLKGTEVAASSHSDSPDVKQRPDSGFEKISNVRDDPSPSQDTSTSRADCFEKVSNVRDSVSPSQYTSTSVDSTTRSKSRSEQVQKPDSGFEKISNARDDLSPSQDTSASVSSTVGRKSEIRNRDDCFEKVSNVRDSVTPSQYTSTPVEGTQKRSDSDFEKISNNDRPTSPFLDVGTTQSQRKQLSTSSYGENTLSYSPPVVEKEPSTSQKYRKSISTSIGSGSYTSKDESSPRDKISLASALEGGSVVDDERQKLPTQSTYNDDEFSDCRSCSTNNDGGTFNRHRPAQPDNTSDSEHVALHFEWSRPAHPLTWSKRPQSYENDSSSPTTSTYRRSIDRQVNDFGGLINRFDQGSSLTIEQQLTHSSETLPEVPSYQSDVVPLLGRGKDSYHRHGDTSPCEICVPTESNLTTLNMSPESEGDKDMWGLSMLDESLTPGKPTPPRKSPEKTYPHSSKVLQHSSPPEAVIVNHRVGLRTADFDLERRASFNADESSVAETTMPLTAETVRYIGERVEFIVEEKNTIIEGLERRIADLEQLVADQQFQLQQPKEPLPELRQPVLTRSVEIQTYPSDPPQSRSDKLSRKDFSVDDLLLESTIKSASQMCQLFPVPTAQLTQEEITVLERKSRKLTTFIDHVQSLVQENAKLAIKCLDGLVPSDHPYSLGPLARSESLSPELLVASSTNAKLSYCVGRLTNVTVQQQRRISQLLLLLGMAGDQVDQ